MSVNSKMTAIADKVRSLLGLTGTMGLDAMSANLDAAVSQSAAQAELIGQIKTALEGKAGGSGGTVLPTLTNPGSASDLVEGKQLIGSDGSIVEGSVYVAPERVFVETQDIYKDGGHIVTAFNSWEQLVRDNTLIEVYTPTSCYGEAEPGDVAKGKTFTSRTGLMVEGTAEPSGGMVVKTGTTTSRTIDTGLSDIEQLFLYKESLTATGLIHLHYTKTATSRMYASAWSTQNYGSKTVTNGTGGVTVSGGTVTVSATQAAQGALSSNVTYKWIAVGRE